MQFPQPQPTVPTPPLFNVLRDLDRYAASLSDQALQEFADLIADHLLHLMASRVIDRAQSLG